MGLLHNIKTEFMQTTGGMYNSTASLLKKEMSLLVAANRLKNTKNGCIKMATKHMSTITNMRSDNKSLINIFSNNPKNHTTILDGIYCKRICSFQEIKTNGIHTGLFENMINNESKRINTFSYFSKRAMSSKSEVGQNEKKLINWKPDDSLDKRYALALYNISKKKNIIPVMVKDIQYLQKNLIGNKEVNNFFNMPIISQEKKLEALVNICKKNNPNNLIAINFLSTAFKKGRFKDLDKIFTNFLNMVEEEKEVLECVIYTGKLLTEDKKKAVSNKIHEVAKGAYQPKIRYEVDPSIIGGIIYHIGTNVYDFSTRERLNQIKSHLT